MESEKKLRSNCFCEMIVALHALSSVVRLYDSNNTAVVRQIDTLVDTLQRGFTDGVNTIRLTLRSDEFFINGQLLKVDVSVYMRARVGGIREYELDDITFLSSISKDDIQRFVIDFAKCIRKRGYSIFKYRIWWGVRQEECRVSSSNNRLIPIRWPFG